MFLICERIGHGARRGAGRKKPQDNNFTVTGSKAVGDIDISPAALIDLCLAENDRRMAGYDPRLLRPTVMPRAIALRPPFPAQSEARRGCTGLVVLCLPRYSSSRRRPGSLIGRSCHRAVDTGLRRYDDEFSLGPEVANEDSVDPCGGGGARRMAGLVLYFGFDAVLASLQAVGVAGFAAMCAIHLVLVVFMGLAWWVLLPGTRPLRVIWGRLVRDSGSEVLPLSQVGGYVLGARAVALAGVSGTVAAASTIVDVTLEFIAQLAYTALGLAWLAQLRPDSAVALPITIGLGVASITAVLPACRAAARDRLYRPHCRAARRRLGRAHRFRRGGVAQCPRRDLPQPRRTVVELRAASGLLDRQRRRGMGRAAARRKSRSGSTPCWSSSA